MRSLHKKLLARMKPLSKKLLAASEDWERDHGKTYLHWCPGCKQLHIINVEKPNHCQAVWSFDGNLDRPTFSPSINIVGHCHYFIHGGQIQFCSDSRHELAGRTVELPDLPADYLDRDPT